jgi:hypothetical protein
MSFGKKLAAAAIKLKAEGISPGIRTVELEKRIAEKLIEFGSGRGEIPSHRTFLRHLDDLRALLQPADGTLWHFRDDAAGSISGTDDAEHQEGKEMEARRFQSDRMSMQDTTGSSRAWLQVVKWDHPLDEVLSSGYLDTHYLAFRQGDKVELQASDFSWMCGFIVVSVNRSARTVNTL